MIVDKDFTTAEPIHSRRRPILPSNERRKRWSTEEILIDETIIEQSTPENEETTNSATTGLSNDIGSYNSTSAQITSEGTRHPLLRQDIVENNQTEELSTMAANDDANNSTVLTTILYEITTLGATEPPTTTKINETQSPETSEATTDAPNSATTQERTSKSSEPETTIIISINQTKQEAAPVPSVILTTPLPTSELDTAIILMDFTTKFPPITTTDYENETLNETETTTASYYTTTILQDNITETTIFLNTTQNITTATTDYEIENTTVISYVTSTNIIEENEYSNDTNEFLPVTEAEPICDLTCQCTKECPYGFQFINDTCECDPLCKVRQQAHEIFMFRSINPCK